MRATRLLLVAAVTAAALMTTSSPPAQAADAIEQDYMTGGWATATNFGTGGSCAPGQAPTGAYSLIYPTPLGGLGLDHPIVVWGNGSTVANDAVCNYLPVLQEFASHGFVVVAVNSGQVGSGVAMKSALDSVVALNSNPSSIFYQHLATTKTAAIGHSQGAVGAMNAAIDNPGAFDTVLAISTPDREDLTAYNLGCAVTGCIPVTPPARNAANSLPPTFFARATGLHNTPNCSVDDWIADKTHHTTATEGYYPTTGTRPFAAATVRNGLPASGDCSYFGVYPHLDPFTEGQAYMSAWLAYHLWGSTVAPTARSAFVGSPAEISTNGRWQGITLQALP